MKVSFLKSVCALSLTLGAGSVFAAPITQWSFNSVPTDGVSSTGSTTPIVGVGTITTIGGTTSTFASGSPGDPLTTDNTGFNVSTFPAQSTGSGTAGIEVAVSTAGSTGAIQIKFDFRQSSTVSRFFQLQASSDGTTFNNVSGGTASFGTVNNNINTSFSNTGLLNNNTTGSQTFLQDVTYTFADGSEFENNPNFKFRFVAVFDPASGTNYISSNAGTSTAYSPNGTARFDVLSVAAVPEPTSLAFLGLGAVGLLSRRRRNA